MKKLAIIIPILFFLFTSCKKEPKEVINVYADKNLYLLVNEIAQCYEEKNKSIKINISYEKPLFFDSLDSFDVLITADETIFSPTLEKEDSFAEEKEEKKFEIKKSKEIEQTIDFSKNFESSDFTNDKIIIVGRRKIYSLNDLLYSELAIPEYNNNVGYIFMKELLSENLFKDISKRIEYTDDTISAMQKVDLYEVDYAIINSLLLNYVKNSVLCYIPKIDDKEIEIFYKKYIRKEASQEAMKFYIFLENKKAEKIIQKNKKI